MKHPLYANWPYKKVKPHHVEELIRRYEAGESARQICLDMPFKEDAALRVLKDFGVHIKTRKEIQLSLGSTINVGAFSDTDDPDCAYYFGWLITDGYITKTRYGYKVGIEINSGDRYVLEGMCKYVGLPLTRVTDRERLTGFRGEGRVPARTQVSSFSFSFEPISDRLQAYGLHERKSLRENPTDKFATNPHFWRGVFEGDGYISKLGADNKLQLCGSEAMCVKWAAFCQSVVPGMSVSIRKQVGDYGSTIFHTYSGKHEECKAVLDAMYLGTTPERRLKRKYDVYVGRFYGGKDPNQ